MSDRRPLLLLFIGLTFCLSMWRISLQEPTYEIIDDVIQNNDTKEINQIFQSTNSMPTQQPTLPQNDINRLINLYDFHYLINKPKCNKTINVNSKQLPFVLILVHSAPRNRDKRNVIRDTWGQLDESSIIYFLLGNVNDSQLQNEINHENELFSDIIQGNFVDAYPNMTYKHVMALKWFTYNCPKMNYLLKTDDDVFINTPKLYEYLNGTADRENFIFCLKYEYSLIKRSYRSKWRVSPREYAGKYYPPYCPGFSIVYSADAVFKLYREAQLANYFWIDDVHITGTLTRKVNITIKHLGDTFMNVKDRDNILNGYSNLDDRAFLFTEPNLEDDQVRFLWNLVMAKKNHPR